MSRAQLTSTVEQNTGGAVAPFVAGKNKIINGDFGIWQRGAVTTTVGAYANVFTADRWFISNSQNSATVTGGYQAFTPGNPITGYEPISFHRLSISGSTSSGIVNLWHRIENVQTFAGQTATLSFWAKASASITPGVLIYQGFAGGSSDSAQYPSVPTIGTTWQRYSITVNINSISGKTINAGSYLAIIFQFGSVNTVFDLWGVQLEAGSVATPFTTASNTLQGELALCQRYYWRGISGASYGFLNGAGFSYTSSNAQISVTYPVTMRAIPSSVDYSSLVVQDSAAGIFSLSSITLDASVTNTIGASFAGTTSGMTTNRFLRLLGSGSTAYIGFSADL